MVGVGGTETDGVGIGAGEEAVVLVRKKGYNLYLTLQLGFKILPPYFPSQHHGRSPMASLRQLLQP